MVAGDEQNLSDVEDVLGSTVSPNKFSCSSKRSRLAGRVVRGS